MRKLLRCLLGLVACGVLIYAGWNLTDYLRESHESTSLNKSLVEEAVVVKETTPRTHTSETTPATESAEETLPAETAPIAVDFDYLRRTNADVVGWLYSAETPINFPVVQGKNNDYYLYRMLDGNWNSSGTAFLDYRNAGDFSDDNTILYAHNMKNKEKFGTLTNYKEQSYYDEHPVMWLLTPDGDYKLELVAGYVTGATAKIYSFDLDREEVFSQVRKAVDRSTFQSGVVLSEEDRFLTMSTCSYEYDDARYVLIARLLPLA